MLKMTENKPLPGRLKNRRLIQLENVTLRVRDTFLLSGTCWKIEQGQHWAILGPNGAGKTTLVKALAGEVPVVEGTISAFRDQSNAVRAEYVSFEQHQRLMVREEQRDEFRHFSGHLNGTTTVHEILIEGSGPPEKKSAAVQRAAAGLGIGHLLGRGIRALSTGEMRKVQIARLLLDAPEIMILDEPFDGLDQAARLDLAQIIDDLMDETRTIILVTHRQREILHHISHVLAVKDGAVIFQGRREEVLTPARLEHLYAVDPPASFAIPAPADGPSPAPAAGSPPEILVEMKHVTVQYDGTTALDTINWTVRAGENWVVSGPNGSGKTTLLNLITADHPQAYANEIYLFGRRRGSGESIWDIKERIGMISAEFHIRYRKPITAFEAVLSGFFDSVGLYRHASRDQKQIAEKWMTVLGIAPKADKIFNQLSYGEQRMVLLARSMVKMPRILILDEPYQGLDRTNRQRLLEAIDVIGRHSGTQIIYVTHYPDEIPACMTHMLQFEITPAGGYHARQRPMNPKYTAP